MSCGLTTVWCGSRAGALDVVACLWYVGATHSRHAISTKSSSTKGRIPICTRTQESRSTRCARLALWCLVGWMQFLLMFLWCRCAYSTWVCESMYTRLLAQSTTYHRLVHYKRRKICRRKYPIWYLSTMLSLCLTRAGNFWMSLLVGKHFCVFFVESFCSSSFFSSRSSTNTFSKFFVTPFIFTTSNIRIDRG